MSRYTIVDGATHYAPDNHVKAQAVIACVQEIYADQSWTVQVLAAAVMAEYQLDHGVDPDQVRAVLKRAFARQFTTDPQGA